MNERDELFDEFMATGDSRRCPRHPGVRTSSNDGMFDAPCHVCEGGMEDAMFANAVRVEEEAVWESLLRGEV